MENNQYRTCEIFSMSYANTRSYILEGIKLYDGLLFSLVLSELLRKVCTFLTYTLAGLFITVLMTHVLLSHCNYIVIVRYAIFNLAGCISEVVFIYLDGLY